MPGGLPRAGALDRMIEIQRAVEAQDSTGQAISTWSRYARAWANVESVDAIERFYTERPVSPAMKVFTLRWVDGVTAKDRILYDEQVYNILSIAEFNGRKAWLKIVAELKV